MTRKCNECTLCCKLVPVKELEKPANTRCQYQRQIKGCTIYHDLKMPISCSLWNCRWLVNDDTNDLARPDRAHYVIDIMPDSIIAQDQDRIIQVQTVQIWCDPNWPDAHRDPKLREYLLRRGEEGIVGQIRYGSEYAIILIPPNMNMEKKWIEKPGDMKSDNINESIRELQAQGKKVENW
jgi:hypothetical protein